MQKMLHGFVDTWYVFSATTQCSTGPQESRWFATSSKSITSSETQLSACVFYSILLMPPQNSTLHLPCPCPCSRKPEKLSLPQTREASDKQNPCFAHGTFQELHNHEKMPADMSDNQSAPISICASAHKKNSTCADSDFLRVLFETLDYP